MIIDINLSIANGAAPRSFSVNKIVAFDCPQIDDSHINIYPSACNKADGSITGITTSGTITGTMSFTWYAVDNTVLSNTADLLNVPPGTYTLELRDQSKCLPVKKKYVVGQRNTIIIDNSTTRIKASACKPLNGSITNISIQNATQFQWFNEGKLPIAKTPDLINVPSGVYRLVVSNATGCSTTTTYQVPSTAPFPGIVHIDTVTGTCNYMVGALIFTFNPQPNDPACTYYFKDPNGLVVTDDSGNPVTGQLSYSPDGPVKIRLPIGQADVLYSLTLTDNNYCTSIVGRYSLPNPAFILLSTGPEVLVRNDACGRHTGGVFGLKTKGGSGKYYGNPPPEYWTWTDSLGNVVGHFPDLTLVGKGTYKLFIQDIHGCNITQKFTIHDSTAEALPPGLNNITLCLPATTTLSVINPNTKYLYRLYDSAQNVINENHYGIFQQKVIQTSKFYVTTIDGLCESEQTPVTVNVVAPGVIIPNAFTPNNDGINDYWDIPHINEFPGAEISIYNREGQLVYHSTNYSHPFDGKFNNGKLPSGVYYYTIDLKKPECFGKISGSLTLIR